jgi:hypothetical protein
MEIVAFGSRLVTVPKRGMLCMEAYEGARSSNDNDSSFT